MPSMRRMLLHTGRQAVAIAPLPLGLVERRVRRRHQVLRSDRRQLRRTHSDAGAGRDMAERTATVLDGLPAQQLQDLLHDLAGPCGIGVGQQQAPGATARRSGAGTGRRLDARSGRCRP
ncbi:hypothetical protein WR25_00512 [Diploscapter pachys]|uniref:Uncharacterized protein n=1 Tax=Diploscapter pachys TaxID=2018661 RepID=A0A2A2M3F7_9BILA|nr:hypothetical protein WR25_00512 [Diploscapter pachys]